MLNFIPYFPRSLSAISTGVPHVDIHATLQKLQIGGLDLLDISAPVISLRGLNSNVP